MYACAIKKKCHDNFHVFSIEYISNMTDTFHALFLWHELASQAWIIERRKERKNRRKRDYLMSP